jgi:hypothetical protein
MMLLNEVRFDSGYVFGLDRPLFLMPGDQVRMDGDRLVIRRTTGHEERPSGHGAPWCWRWRLL